MIDVTIPFLPPKAEYDELLKGIWERNWLTNNGPLVNDLELRLKEYFGLNHLLFMGNGTISLQVAMKALELKGEIITTPFSYVATTSSIVWESCKPVFVDIDKDTFNVNVDLIEQGISEKTSAILVTHVFGNPCDINKISTIAKANNLKVIYDAAHCFGTVYQGKSILEFGDISCISFHATKLFHTTEGGAVVTKSPELLKKMSYLRNFGHDGFEKFNGIGINGKNSEFHAAMGLANLKYVDEILRKRKSDTSYYKLLLKKAPVKFQIENKDGETNNSYFPVLFEDEQTLNIVKTELEKNRIFPRRYFFPLLSDLEYIPDGYDLPIASQIGKSILCLPLYYKLTREEIKMICRIILRVLNN